MSDLEKEVDQILTPEIKTQEDQREYTKKEDSNSLQVVSISDRIKTIKDALAHGKIDTAIWYVDSSECKSYECAMKVKQPDGSQKSEVVSLWAIKIKLKRRITKAAQVEAETLIERFRDQAPIFPKLNTVPYITDPHMLELSLCDIHFGKLAWRLETGANYDLKITRERYLTAIKEIISRIQYFPLEKILLPIGNDLFHVDNMQNTTTKGTPQDAEGRYGKIWAVGKETVIEAVELLLQIAPVEIIYVPGNHDRLISYHLCQYLEAYFRHSDRVTVDSTPTSRKYVLYGPTVLGFTHGDEEKHSSLPGIMMHEARKLLAKAESLEIHLGHFHKTKETIYINTDTHAGGVRIRILPSLSGTDKWHYSKGYVGSQAGEAYLWSKNTGYVGHFSANVKG